MSTLSVLEFKNAVSHFATGVVLVTATTAQGRSGFTCQSFASLSLDPMLVSFAVTHAGASWALMHDATTFGVSILGAEHEDVARRFATSGIDKFDGLEFVNGPQGAPLLATALGQLEGEVVTVTRHGDHDIVVVAADFAETRDGDPLLFWRGRFGTFA